MSDEPVRILAPIGFANRLTRRQLIFGAAGAAGATLLISACGSDKKGTTKGSGTVNLYTWGEYHDPDLISEASGTIGVDMSVQFYASNEELIAKLEATRGNSGFDLIVPTGPYLPQMIAKELLLKLDKSKIPNFKNIDAAYLGREWDPANEWAVPRDWGSTGYLYDSSLLPAPFQRATIG